MDYQEQIAIWLDEIDAEFRPFLRGLSEQAAKDFMAEKLATRLETACNEDPEFKKKYIHHVAEQDIKEWLEYREPQGKYDPQAVFPLDDSGT